MKNILEKLEDKLNDFEVSKHGKLKIYIGLLIFYVILHLSNVLVLRSFSGAIIPLNSLYIANNLLLSGGQLNLDLVTTVISPSNGMLIVPPVIHLLSYILGSVKNIFLFLFMVQLVVPILSYKLFRLVSSPLVSLLLSVFSSYYFISTDWWTPDYLIQPLIIFGFLILLSQTKKFEVNRCYKLVYVGLITGIVIVLKHNEGIFWGVLVVSFLLFCSIVFSNDNQYTKRRPLLFVLFAGFFVFGFLFLSKQIHVDAVVYYLFPYFTFWGMITYYTIKNKFIGFDSVTFLKNVSSFSISALIFPCIVFLWMGGAVGYVRYLTSLFGMGFQYLPIWDHGISGIIGTYAKFQSVLTLESIFFNYQSIVFFILFLLPFVVNCLVNKRLFHLICNKATNTVDLKKYFEVASMSILGIFMFYPLEGYHILSTKFFIFLFVLLYLLRYCSIKFSTIFKVVIILMVIPVIMFSIYQPIAIFGIATSYGSENVENAFGLPIEKKLAEEISMQVAVVERATQGSSYYVIDSSGGTLASLMAIENNYYPQYYLEMRKGILNQEVTDAVISSLQQTPFVLVNYNDYQKYLSGQQDDPFMAQILDFVYKNYVIVDRYEEPSLRIPQILSFLIMEKKSP